MLATNQLSIYNQKTTELVPGLCKYAQLPRNSPLCSGKAAVKVKDTTNWKELVNLSRKISAHSHLKVYTGSFPLGMTYSAKDNAQVT